MKRIISLIITIAIVLNMMVFSVSASTANLELTGEILATVIDVDIPTTASFTIDPNIPEGSAGRYTMPTLSITNNTTAPVTMTMTGFDNKAGTANQFTEVASDAKEWDRLGTTESKSYIYLALTGEDDQPGYLNHTTLLSQASADQVQLGEKELCNIKAGGTVALDLECRSGSTFPSQLTSVYELTFVVSLYEGLEEMPSTVVPEPDVPPVGMITSVTINGVSTPLDFTRTALYYIDVPVPQTATFTITTSTPDFTYTLGNVKYTGSQTITTTNINWATNNYFSELSHMYNGVQARVTYSFY